MRKITTCQFNVIGNAYLTEKEYKILLHRFGIQEEFRVYDRPGICSDYINCKGCPLALFGGEAHGKGCIQVWHSFDLETNKLALYPDWIRAFGGGIEQAKAIHNWLVNLEEVKDVCVYSTPK